MPTICTLFCLVRINNLHIYPPVCADLLTPMTLKKRRNRDFDGKGEKKHIGKCLNFFNWRLTLHAHCHVNEVRFQCVRNCLDPMQCTGNSGCFPREKRAAIVRRYPAVVFVFLCALFSCFHILQAVMPTRSRHMYMGSLTCAQTWVRAVYSRKGVTHNQVCTGVVSEGHKNACFSPGPARGSNPGSSDLNSNCLTTEPRPPPMPAKGQGFGCGTVLAVLQT